MGVHGCRGRVAPFPFLSCQSRILRPPPPSISCRVLDHEIVQGGAGRLARRAAGIGMPGGAHARPQGLNSNRLRAPP